METRWLKDFEALAAQRNFSRAAEECNVSQPAFSRRIRMLESEVGVRLIDRQTLPLSLTPAGEVFLAQAQKIRQTYDETLERCQAVDAASADVIRFATTQSLYLTHYETHIKPLVNQGGLDIDLNSTSWAADQFVSALQQRYCDVILTYWHPSMDFLAPLEVAKCDYITIAYDRLVPVMKNTPQAVSLSDNPRKPVPVLGYGVASALDSAVGYIMRQHIKAPPVLVVSRNAQAIGVKAMIQQDFGMGWLPHEMCKQALADKTLIPAGDASFETDLEIRLYKDSENSNAQLDTLWACIKAAVNTERGDKVVKMRNRKTASRP